ncbi:Helicase and polymerase-containing protein TEBICHI [Linum grandiflorum]
MTSDSPKTQINQFYASKKRKLSSPAPKAGRAEKGARLSAEGSPISKGTLPIYLVGSKEEDHVIKAVSEDRAPKGGQLLSERNRFSKQDNKDLFSSVQWPSKGDNTRKETSQGSSNVGNVAIESALIGCPVSGAHTENLELKQFATDFLSLYCSELHSTATSPSKTNLTDYKIHSNHLSEDGKDRVPKKRLYIPNQLHSGHLVACSTMDKVEDMQSIITPEDKTCILGASEQHQSGLKKCDKKSKLTVNLTDCCTPGPPSVKAHLHETPKSAGGSSMFSPGEAFWCEAIQVADGIFADTNNALTIVSMNDGNNGDNPMEVLYEAEGRSQVMGNGSYRESVMKNRNKSSAEEVSPLPVKHLNFLLDEKASNSDIQCDATKSLKASRDGKQSASRMAGLKHCQTTSVLGSLCKAGANHEAHGEKKNIDSSPPKEANVSVFNNSCIASETPSSLASCKDGLEITNWLPAEVCCIYGRRGITKLYPWQVECLQVDGVLQRRNLVYSASTSAGKSFVAEILMLRRVISMGKIAILVLPYVSLCAEKAEHLESLLEPLGKHVRSFYGNQGGATLPKDTSVAVCTIEKANFLINRLLEEGRLLEIGIIVIDELHMVGDQSRGYLLELMLTKLRYATGEGNSESSSGEGSGTSSKGDPTNGLQIVGMSATMPNVGAVADWLQAALYQTDFRPVPLEEYIKVGNTIYDKKLNIIRTIPKVAERGGKDPDHIVSLCDEVVQEGHSVLIFCSSRKGCESTARHVAKFLKGFSANVQNDSDFLDISSAVDALRRCPVGLDPVLEETLPCGVAYHHAGLTAEEREIIETCYRRGLVRVLTATSTLAAGVNLPARRVIFRQPRVGRDFIDGTRYRQMAGRAGRTGIDTKGESVLICKADELKRIMELLNESCPPLQSCLSEEKNGMTHAILEVVAGGIVQSANDIHRYVKCTLLNATKHFNDVVKSAQDSLRWLCHKKFVEWNEDTKLYSSTPLGRASFGSSLSPEESLIVLDDLSRAREAFVLASDLHLVYLVTPTNVDVEPDWEVYYGRFVELSAIDQSVGNRVGVMEPFLMRMAHGAPMRHSKKSTINSTALRGKLEKHAGLIGNSNLSDEQALRVCKRFYVALILSRLVQESPVAEVCEAFKVARGMVQALQENSGRFASMVTLFCERLGWHDLEGLVSKFQNRVSFGVRAEIVELTTIPHVKGSRARALYKAGLRAPTAIAEASIPDIVKALFETSTWSTVQECSAQRRVQFGVAKKIKNGARRIVLEKAEEARMAAFSAFQSLGLSVPHLSRPLLYDDAQNPVDHGAVRDEKTSTISPAEQAQLLSLKLAGVAGKTFVKVGSKGEGHESAKALDFGPACLGGVTLSNPLQSTDIVDPTLLIRSSILKSNPDCSADAVVAAQLGKTGDLVQRQEHIGCESEEQGDRKSISSKEKLSVKGPINASSVSDGFDCFLDLWGATQEFYFDIHYTKPSRISSAATFDIHGIAICWENSPVYYIKLPKDLLEHEDKKNNDPKLEKVSEMGSHLPTKNMLETVQRRWNRIGEIMRKRNVKKFTWNLKVQMQVLKKASFSARRFGLKCMPTEDLGLQISETSDILLPAVNIREGVDLCVVAWILWPDEERSSNPSLEKEVKKRLSSEAIAAANWISRWKNQMRGVAHNGCCRRVAQIRALSSVLWKLLVSEGLLEPLNTIEIPLVNVLAEMEMWGIGVDMEGCIQARTLLGKKIRHLEKEAYELAGVKFSLNTPADIAHILFSHLKLPLPERLIKGKQHPSTDKHCLDWLRHEHPIIPIIKEHRTLAKLLNSTLGSICSLGKLSISSQKYTIHGRWLQTSTATGRLSMEEPNLQCVEHMVDFKMRIDESGSETAVGHYKVNARDFFVPTQDSWVLLTADYSQIELRLMAHFSMDTSLIELLSKPQSDVFTMIAAKWTGKSEDSVNSDERDHTKRLVYGILYGMGANSLAEQLDCSPDEAAEKIRSFKNSFPGVACWLKEAVSSCREKGYVKTLKGRKRFLSKIKFGNSEEKAKAQRQAVNSICQGSAADIIKIAMITLHSVIFEETGRTDCDSSLVNEFHMLKGRCRILLQVHDELVVEADPSVIKEAASLLQMSMENAVLLRVPLLVKLRVGPTWGSLEPLKAGNYANGVQVTGS